jgi:hypothetical protein
VDRPRSHLLIGLLVGAGVALWLGGAAMIQSAQASAGGSEFWCYLGVGLLVVGTLALLSVLAIVGPIAKRLPWGKASDPVVPEPDVSGPYENPEEQLDSLLAAANQFANILKNFDNWWPAVKEKGFEDKLSDGTSVVTHEEAKQTLLYAFAQFFSAAWTYEDHSRDDWHRRKDLKEYVREVYNALGQRPIGDIDDETIMSGQLHRIGELSTERWRSAEARPLGRADFEAKAEKDPRLAAALNPLEKFLHAAKPDTEPHARVEAAEKAVQRVKEWLERNHRP